MYGKLLIAVGAAMLVAAPSYAAPCKDAHGKFIKCPPAAVVVPKPAPAPAVKPAAVRCKDAKGKFIKCAPVAAAKPAPTTRCRDAKGRFKKC